MVAFLSRPEFAALRRAFVALAVALGCIIASGASACTTTANVSTSFTSYSPAAIKAGAVPALKSAGGLNCVPSTIVLLGMNYIKAKFHSQNGLTLKNGAGGSIAYTASPDSGATVAFTQDGTVDYMQNNLLNVLGLLSGTSADFPFYLKPGSGTAPAIGTYSDQVTITWNWYLCQGLSAALLCLGTPDQGSGTTIVNITFTVGAKNVTVSATSQTTWDPIDGTLYPKSLPGGRRRATWSVANPDIVALEANSMSIVVPVPYGQQVALDGDGSGTAVFNYADGSPASSLTFTYTSPSSTSDDVEFSNDNGNSWTYVPVAGDSASQAAVTTIRLKPKGTMAAGSTFSISMPFLTR